MPYFSHDDIAQIATPPGLALTGVVRLSGEGAWGILARVTLGLEDWLESAAKTRCVRPCRLLVPLKRPGEAVRDTSAPPLACPARALLMPGPGTFTGENVAEVQLPGARVILTAGLEALVRAGARAAAPGEFTFRAYRNGRITLGQAEAVEEVVRAGDAGERRRALAKLGGGNREKILRWRERLLDITARVEAELDFSEEDLDDRLVADLGALVEELAGAGIALTGSGGARENALPRVTLLGLTNAGKSSLLNRLLGREAALVSAEASTTRDALPHEAVWQGARLLLVDNPGFDPDRAGSGGRAAARGFRGQGGEEIAVWVVDAARELGGREEEFVRGIMGRTGRLLVALNKADLPARTGPEAMRNFLSRFGAEADWCGRVSAASGVGLEEFRVAVARFLAGSPGSEESGWNLREKMELAAALAECRAAGAELAGGGRLELAAENLRNALAAFLRTLGEGYGEEVLTRIFSRFCLGK